MFTIYPSIVLFGGFCATFLYSNVLCARVKSLSNVLREVNDVLPQRDLSDQQKANLEEISQGCKEVLKDLEDMLDRYQELDSKMSGPGKRSRRVWKRLRWDQKAIDRLRSQIVSNILILDTFQGAIDRSAFVFLPSRSPLK